ncbi:MAG TPA: hypothetical protein P5519_02475 [Spirochaetia bacterium]|nr:hypothetical protein [Spirochaetales bacterium]HPD80243.1 hypothetical protein [Spirochaetales bacterium]HRS64740.1 hypothetical protein [Spirochaetia bacterium]HRV28621.1 hypothetical protein [Spirochaetia bacterium]
MKRIIFISIFTLLACLLVAQDIYHNEYFVKSQELLTQAQEAFDNGDYDMAADLAAQAQEYAKMSDLYVAKMLAKRAADEALLRAEERIVYADSIEASRWYPAEYTAAQTSMETAKTEYAAENYLSAKQFAEAVLVSLADIKPPVKFPAYYIVVERNKDTDCFWRIAALPFIYNNPLMWTVIYEANKRKLPDPNNPNLVRPGTLLVIPSIRGELREGTYDPKLTYPIFDQK